MRTLILSSVLLILTAVPAPAQMLVQPWSPRPTVGIAAGLFGEFDQAAANDPNPTVSGTYEIPFTRDGRIRIEAARARVALVPDGVVDDTSRGDTAHVSIFTVGVSGLRSPGAPLSAYYGVGYGVYRASFDKARRTPLRGGVHFYGGGELLLSGRVSLDAELGVHLLREALYPRNTRPVEAVMRMKLGV